jgi:hypothetical protein
MVEELFDPLPFYAPTVSVGQDVIGVLVFFRDPSQLILPNAEILGAFFNCQQILFPHRDCKSFYVYHLSILVFYILFYDELDLCALVNAFFAERSKFR